MPKVSILIPTHNRPNNVKRAITSALNQNIKDVEIIVRNDSDTNILYPINWIRKNVDLYYEEEAKGFDYAYVSLIKKATGKYIYYLEDDDYLVNKDILKKCVDMMEKNNKINASIFKSSTKLTDYILYKNKQVKNRVIKSSQMFEMFPDISIDFQLGQVFFRKELVKDIILEEDYGSEVNTDASIFLKLCLQGGYIALLDEIGFIITIGKDNLSWFNFENCFYGAHSYINRIYTLAKKKNIKNLDLWKEKMENNHIDFILKYLDDYYAGIINE